MIFGRISKIRQKTQNLAAIRSKFLPLNGKTTEEISGKIAKSLHKKFANDRIAAEFVKTIEEKLSYYVVILYTEQTEKLLEELPPDYTIIIV